MCLTNYIIIIRLINWRNAKTCLGGARKRLKNIRRKNKKKDTRCKIK